MEIDNSKLRTNHLFRALGGMVIGNVLGYLRRKSKCFRL